MRGLPGVLGTALLVVAACSPEIVSTAPSGRPSALPSPTAGVIATGLPLPSGSDAPSLEPSPAASPSAAPTPSTGPGTLDVLLPGSAIEVNVAELNLRRRPSTSAQRIEILKRGQVLIVSPYDALWFGFGPVKRDGYTWYPVMKLQTGDADGDLPALPTRPILIGTEVQVGWIASDDGERSYIRAVPPRCPTTVDLGNVEGMLAAERLACFGGPIVLEGTYGCPGCGATLPPMIDPLWIGYQESLDFLSVDASNQIGPIVLRFKPGGPSSPAPGSIIRATVHVDDPAAQSCSGTWFNAAGDVMAVPTVTIVAYCREQLVVDSYEVIGTDTDFFGG
ncbi:MAG TPA: hypothetical protein VNL94_08950 [Candidatus Binatia bacterium]|nr:hypothetical protein [Candidatus Binatia bacterium]